MLVFVRRPKYGKEIESKFDGSVVWRKSTMWSVCQIIYPDLDPVLQVLLLNWGRSPLLLVLRDRRPS